MRFTNPKSLAVFTALPLLARSFSITETTSGATVAAAIFDGPGLNVLNATGAYTSGDRNVDNGVGGYDYVCAPNTQNVNALQVQVGLEPGYNGVRIEFVFATQEAPSTLANMDAISILDVTNGPPVQYALDTNANQISALSPFLLTPDAIAPPDSLTGYTRSSPPLVRTISASPGGFVVLMISVCDVGDALNDSGFLLRAEGCVDCGYGSDEVEINYVHTTSTLPPGEQPFTSTISASGTASGTFIVFVEPTGVTTTTSDATTTTTAEETTTTGETTTTTDELMTFTTAEPTTTTTDESTTTTDEVTMTTTTELTTTAKDDSTTTTIGLTTTTEMFTTTAKTTTTEPTTTAVDELTTTELVSTTEQTTSVFFESTTTTADVTSESVSTAQETATTEESTTIISSELETLTADEVSSSTDESTSCTPAESRTTADASPVLSTASEATSISVDQGPVLASDTITSESIVPTTDALSESPSPITSESSSVTAAVSSESTASSIVSTVLPLTPSESTSFAEETSTSEVVPETTFTPVEPMTSSSPEISTTSSSDAPPATSSPADGPSNIDTIRGYTYKGCLGSADGYPSFNLIGSGANMTTSSCVTLARGRAYVGIYDRSCYASDSLDSTSLVLNGRCDIPCPGDSSHFCGGLVVSSSERRWVGPRKALDKRAAPANILLTLYALDDEPPAPSETSTEAEVPLTTQDGVAVIPTESVSSRPVATVTGTVTESLVLRPVETAIDSVTQPGQTLVETTVTTVTYTIVDPNNPSTLTVTEYCATLSYEPCSRCAHPPIPTVEMTTYVMPCKSCGYHGENRVTITAPCAAITESARNGTHGSQDSVDDFAPTRAAYQAVPGPVRTVTTALRQAKPTAGAESSTPEPPDTSKFTPCLLLCAAPSPWTLLSLETSELFLLLLELGFHLNLAARLRLNLRAFP
ncbi:hypothetical protein FCIRC_3375 [Fusarium circinatum]|uniref:WSC domain-containing protein n=1 Tax=Fusarium circinatum TaxID=48490 RepID=A0A8H5UE61_FUSCI|nr:hypothetical protein FCIRC_3375 [Fusarium circinatum]